MTQKLSIAIILAIFPFFACSATLHLQKSNFSQLPGWQQDNLQQALPALQKSCEKVLERARYRDPNTDARATYQWRKACEVVLSESDNRSNAQIRAMFERYYQPWLVTSAGSSQGLFTGYYEPTIKGSLTPTSEYRVPLYGRPTNLVKVNHRYRLNTAHGYVRLPSRAEISNGPALKSTPVIAWIHSKVDRFFLQIQGSGSITLPNGKQVLLGYAGQNGWKYYPIGAYLVNSGALSANNVSLQTIKAWLNAHPDQAQRVMNMNPSFTFFRVLNTEQPVGAEGIPLTPQRSLAVDPHFIPYGTALWLNSYYPIVNNGQIQPGKPLQRLMVAQDTGGAIQGPIRGDFFWGSGDQAQWYAGHMQMPGQYWVLLPKGIHYLR